MSGPNIVRAFFILVTLIGNVFNMLPRTMLLKSAADGRPTMLYADLDFSASCISQFVKHFFPFTSLHERDVRLIAVGFTVMIIYPSFYPLEMDPFVGYMDSEISLTSSYGMLCLYFNVT